jgi:adenylate cyclase
VKQTLRRLQLGSGVVMLIYVFLHLINHALGIWSLEFAGQGLTLAMRLWHSTPGTVLLYCSAGLHFALALHTIYGRRYWALPPAEWIRLWAGLSLPLLLIRHAVGTRLAASLYGFEPNYERIVISLITSGTQGLQLALLAPGWIHGCLGLWFRVRHHAKVQRGRLCPDDARRRGNACHPPDARPETCRSSARTRRVASQSCSHLPGAGHHRFRGWPDAQLV